MVTRRSATQLHIAVPAADPPADFMQESTKTALYEVLKDSVTEVDVDELDLLDDSGERKRAIQASSGIATINMTKTYKTVIRSLTQAFHFGQNHITISPIKGRKISNKTVTIVGVLSVVGGGAESAAAGAADWTGGRVEGAAMT